MDLSATVWSLTLQVAKAGELVDGFGRWWLKEFLGLFPQRVADWLVDSGGRALVLAPGADAVAFHLKTDRGRLLASSQIGRGDYSTDLIDEFLRHHRCSRAQASIGLSLPQEHIFCRSFALPLAARRALYAVAVQDLLAKTPFELDDIHHGHRVRREGDRFVVSQWVVRRAHVAAAAQALGLAADEIGFIECPDAGADDAPASIVTKRSSAVGRNRWAHRVAFGLACTALLLAVTVLATRYQGQQVLLDGLQAEIAAATGKARRVLGAIDKLRQEQAVVQRLRAERNAPGLLDVWEEATRVLPAHTWLSELRLSETPEGRQVVLSGFSATAAGLVPLLDGSPMFAEAALVGPVTMDPAEGRERFIIQAKLKGAGSPRTASR
ncbi:MAG TPA: PilN domain-containing protein [Hyphomicrobiaceae bacterium]|jgi:general secretion pathway protein L